MDLSLPRALRMRRTAFSASASSPSTACTAVPRAEARSRCTTPGRADAPRKLAFGGYANEVKMLHLTIMPPPPLARVALQSCARDASSLLVAQLS